MSKVRFVPTDEENYNYALNVLPPIYGSKGGFLVSEPVNHRECTVKGGFRATYTGYIQYQGVYYRTAEAVTVPEFNFGEYEFAEAVS